MVNQDDIQTYHLFFADDVNGAGTDMTFYDGGAEDYTDYPFLNK